MTRVSNLNAKEIFKGTQILYIKYFTKILFDLSNTLSIISSENNVIHIYQEDDATTIRAVTNKTGVIRVTTDKLHR